MSSDWPSGWDGPREMQLRRSAKLTPEQRLRILDDMRMFWLLAQEHWKRKAEQERAAKSPKE